jgi:hypothetical protein
MELSQTLSEWYISTVLSGPNPSISVKKWTYTHTSGPTEMGSLRYQVWKQVSYLYSITGWKFYSHAQANRYRSQCHNNLLSNWVAELPTGMKHLTSLITKNNSSFTSALGDMLGWEAIRSNHMLCFFTLTLTTLLELKTDGRHCDEI